VTYTENEVAQRKLLEDHVENIALRAYGSFQVGDEKTYFELRDELLELSDIHGHTVCEIASAVGIDIPCGEVC
jgi:hypothetical protein